VTLPRPLLAILAGGSWLEAVIHDRRDFGDWHVSAKRTLTSIVQASRLVDSRHRRQAPRDAPGRATAPLGLGKYRRPI
jgi:hypothetical protein